VARTGPSTDNLLMLHERTPTPCSYSRTLLEAKQLVYQQSHIRVCSKTVIRPTGNIINPSFIMVSRAWAVYCLLGAACFAYSADAVNIASVS
jgi:hypothetical protein